MLVTEVVRSSEQGDAHGGAYLVNLQTGDARQVLDWNRIDIDWEGRGQGRGLRGIVYDNDRIIIAASDEIFVFNTDFKIIESFRNRYLRHCHEIHLEGRTLYMTSTSYDSVLAFDLDKREFTQGYLVRYQPRTVQTALGPRQSPVLRVGRFDPTRSDGPKPSDTTHINNVTFEGGRVLVSGVRLRCILAIDRKSHEELASVPEWTHNAQPFRDGVIYNSTGEDAVCYADRSGTVLKRFPIPRYEESALSHADIPGDFARQAFARGLIAQGSIVIASSSPSTVTVWDFESETTLASVNFGMDVRNAPHGLAIWPFDT